MTFLASSIDLDGEPAPALSPELAGRLAVVLHALTASREQIEGAFLDIGRHLIEGNALLGGITATFEALQSSGDGSGFAAFEERARRVLAMTGSAAGDARDLSPLLAQIAEIGRPVMALRSAVKSIGLVALGTSISASHLGKGHDFAAFTDDITHLAERSSKAILEFAEVYERLVITLKAAEAKRQAFEANQMRSLAGLTDRLQASLSSAVERRSQAEGANAEIRQLFGRIGEGVASIVMTLQIGDITRQRIEHIEEGLALLLDPVEVAAHAPGGNTAALVAAACRLQVAQGEQSSKDFDREADRVERLIRQVAADASSIVAESRRVHEQAVEASRSALAELTEEVRRACTLMRGYETARIELDEATVAVSTSVKDLLRCVAAVQNIKGGMHLVGINMALKCAWLGPEGHTLNVIAQELRELAGQTVSHANAAVVGLTEAARLAEAYASKADDHGREDIKALEDEVCRPANLQNEDRRTTDALNTLMRDGSRVARLLETAAGRITMQKDISLAVHAAIKALEGIRHDVQGAHMATGAGDLHEAEERVLAQLKSRYTMASERALHDAHAHSRGNSASSANASSPEADLDDIFL